MIDSLPPGLLLIAGALLLPLFRGRLQAALFVALPALSLWHLSGFFGREGVLVTLTLFDHTLVPLRVDKLGLMFALIFHVVALLSAVYAVHVRDTMQHVSALIYAGAAICATFAGDLITLFVFWELTAISSVFLIWASRNEESYRAGLRYLIIHVTSGLLLLAGAIVQFRTSGSLAFERMELGSLASNLIFVAFGIKCAFPLLHNWLQDAYPEATVTGTVFLTSFTTKLAIYVLARGFEGTSPLIWVGVTMTVFPIFYAVIENDLRRVLAYSLNNQLGFMVVGIGIGGPLAINGATSHAFAHLLYKALLFMSMGAVLYRTGTIKATRLGGLYKSMPLTTVCCIVGALSISAFPLFSGFVTKSMVLSAAAEHHMTIAFILLLFASAGVLEHSGIKIPFFAFFAHDSGIRCKEAPTQHADRDGDHGGAVHLHRGLPDDPDAAVAERRRVRGLYADPCADPAADAAFRRPRVRGVDADGAVSERARGDQPRLGLDLPPPPARTVGARRMGRGRADECGATRRRTIAGLDPNRGLPPPRPRGAARPKLGFRRIRLLGLPLAPGLPDRLLQLARVTPEA